MQRFESSPYTEEQMKLLKSFRDLPLGKGTEARAATQTLAVEYPLQVNSRNEAQKIAYNVQECAAHYDVLLPERGLGEAFEKTLNKVAGILSKKSTQSENPLYQNASAELRLLTEVDRLLFTKDFSHFTHLSQGFTET